MLGCALMYAGAMRVNEPYMCRTQHVLASEGWMIPGAREKKR
jgi:hypothetical protein